MTIYDNLAALEGHDELGYAHLLRMFRVPVDAEQTEALKWWSIAATAFRPASWHQAELVEGSYPYGFDWQELENPNSRSQTGTSRVPGEQFIPCQVHSFNRSSFMVIHRSFNDRVYERDASNNFVWSEGIDKKTNEIYRYVRYWDSYDYLYLPVADADQATDIVKRVRSAREFKVHRDLMGFGFAPVNDDEQSELRADEVSDTIADMFDRYEHEQF